MAQDGNCHLTATFILGGGGSAARQLQSSGESPWGRRRVDKTLCRSGKGEDGLDGLEAIAH